jgi:glycyl-tRNA synthetase (class II)
LVLVIDYREDESLKNTVTVRNRDTGEQEQVEVTELVEFLK